MGKLLNEIIDEYVAKLDQAGGLPARPVCIVCGRPATFKYIGFGQQKLYVCSLHEKKGKGLRARKKLGERRP